MPPWVCVPGMPPWVCISVCTRHASLCVYWAMPPCVYTGPCLPVYHAGYIPPCVPCWVYTSWYTPPGIHPVGTPALYTLFVHPVRAPRHTEPGVPFYTFSPEVEEGRPPLSRKCLFTPQNKPPPARKRAQKGEETRHRKHLRTRILGMSQPLQE